MSGATLATIATALQSSAAARGTHALQTASATLRALAFWTAALLPLAYLPVLLPVGPSASLELLLVVLCCHGACLLLGHEYSPPART